MSKELLLIADVEGLGVEGDVVQVADGYARNYLLPRKLVAPVTAATRRKLEKQQKIREEQLASQMEGAQSMARIIESASCTIAVKTGPEGKLFGSVTVADIIEKMAEQDVKIDRNQIKMDEPVRELGVYTYVISLHPRVEAPLKVWVVEE